MSWGEKENEQGSVLLSRHWLGRPTFCVESRADTARAMRKWLSLGDFWCLDRIAGMRMAKLCHTPRQRHTSKKDAGGEEG